MRFSQPLDDALRTASHLAVLRALFGLPDSFPASVREVGRRAGVSHFTASRVLASLVEQGLVHLTLRPNANEYRLNRSHVLVERFGELLAWESQARDELVGFLRDRLAEQAPPVEAAFLFGSVARGDMRGKSDIDLAIVWRRPTPAADEDAAIARISDGVLARFGNHLQVISTTGPLDRLRASSRRVRGAWREAIDRGIVVLPPSRALRSAVR